MDTTGLLLTVLVTAASVQDRDAAKPLLWNLRRAFPSVKIAMARVFLANLPNVRYILATAHRPAHTPR